MILNFDEFRQSKTAFREFKRDPTLAGHLATFQAHHAHAAAYAAAREMWARQVVRWNEQFGAVASSPERFRSLSARQGVGARSECTMQ